MYSAKGRLIIRYTVRPSTPWEYTHVAIARAIYLAWKENLFFDNDGRSRYDVA